MKFDRTRQVRREDLPRSTSELANRIVENPPAYLLGIGSVFTFILSYFSWRRYQTFNAYAFDLGIMEQSMWNTIHGRGPLLYNTPEGASHLQVHLSPIMLLVAPIYMIFQTTIWFVFIQAAVVAVGGYFFFLIADHYLSTENALVVATLYYLNPVLWGMTLNGWHPVILAIPFLMGAFYELLEKDYRWYWIFVGLALACKETVALPVGMLALYQLSQTGGEISRKNIWEKATIPVLTLLIAGGWLIGSFLIPKPASGWSAFNDYYGYLGSSATQIIITAATNPSLWITHLFQFKSIRYVVLLLAPLAFIPILAPKEAGIGLPGLLMVLLATAPFVRKLDTQYPALILPFILIAFVIVIARLPQEARRPIFALIIITSLITGALLIQRPVKYNRFQGAAQPYTTHDQAREKLINEIPNNATVLAQTSMFPHLFKRSGRTFLLDGQPATETNYPNYQYLILTPERPSSLPPGTSLSDYTKNMSLYRWADGTILLKRGYTGPPKAVPLPKRGSLHATYYEGDNFQEQVFNADVSHVTTNWKKGSPAPVVPVNYFTVRWKGELYVPRSGCYNFSVNADDGGSISIDGQHVTGNVHHSIVHSQNQVCLSKGWNTFQSQFWDKRAYAHITIKWKPPGARTYTQIPSQNFAQPGYRTPVNNSTG